MPPLTAIPLDDAPREIQLALGHLVLRGQAALPEHARGWVVFAHGSGSSRHSPRNQQVAARLREERLGTLLFDLLTLSEERDDAYTGRWRFDLELLAGRLLAVIDWSRDHPQLQSLPMGLFGASTGAAAALLAAAARPLQVSAVVSRGGRPDLAGAALEGVRAPTLLIVGERDPEVLALNQEAYERLGGEKAIKVVPGASHLFEEPGALEAVAELASGWFHHHFHAVGPRA